MKYAVEYSYSLRAFKITHFEQLLKYNLDSVIEEKPSDWIPIHITDTNEKACIFIETLEKQIGKRHKTSEESGQEI